MKKIYTYLIFSFALLCSTSLIAQTNEKARETAVMIADRFEVRELCSEEYEFHFRRCKPGLLPSPV